MITQSKKTVTGVRMPAELSRKLSAYAKRKGFTKNAVMVDALWQFIKIVEKEGVTA